MSFVEAFYSFNLHISNSDSGTNVSTRVKTGKHPFETLQFFYARMLAFAHAYVPELRFSQGLHAPTEPTIWRINELQTVTDWIEVGELDAKKLKKALKTAEREQSQAQSPARFASYMFSKEHVQSFCAALRGSKQNWIASTSFSLLDPAALDALCNTHRSSATWSVTVVDSTLYLDCDGTEIITQITPLNMWHEFQHSIDNLGHLSNDLDL